MSLLEGAGHVLAEGTWVIVWLSGFLLSAPVLHLAGKPKKMGAVLRACLVALFITAFALWTVGDVMEERGARAARDGRLGFLEYALGIRTQYVRADFTDTDGLARRGEEPMLYLGQSGGVYVLFDCAASEVVRRPAAQVQLTSGVGDEWDRLAVEAVRSCGRRE